MRSTPEFFTRLFFFTVIFLLVGMTAQAQITYYVSAASGDDNNSGSSQAPFRTIQKCVDTWNTTTEPVTCACTGVFNEEVIVRASGPSPAHRHKIIAWDTNYNGILTDETFVLDGENTRNVALKADSSVRPDNIEIGHLTVRNYFPNNGCNSGGDMHAIELFCRGTGEGCSDWWIHHCTFKDLGVGCNALESYITIRPSNAPRLLVERNTFDNIGGYIMRYIGGPDIHFVYNVVNQKTLGIKGWDLDLDRLYIAGNIFTGDGDGDWADDNGKCVPQPAVALSNNAQFAEIRNNIFINCQLIFGTSEDFSYRDNAGHLVEANFFGRTEQFCNPLSAPFTILDVSTYANENGDSLEVRDIVFRNNILHYYGTPLSYNRGPAIDITSAHSHFFNNNLQIYNNTMRGFYYGIRFEDRPSYRPSGTNITVPLPYQINGVEVRNNIFSQIRRGHISLNNNGIWDNGGQPGDFFSDNNTFSGPGLFRWDGNRNLGNWQTLGYDLNSFSCDPVFDDLSSLRLSPLDDCARNSGTPLNSFKYDIDDQERGNEDGWDIGADEYYETVIASLLSNVDAAKALISEETALFPNPGQEGFFIKLPDENSAVKVVVRDAQGRMVKSFESEAGRMIFKVEMADQPDGIYFIQIGRAGRPFENLKWLKNR